MKHIGFILGVVLLNMGLLPQLTAGPGALDPSFNPTLNGSVYAIGTQVDGRVVIGGNFTSVNNVNRSRIARLFPDGSLDSSFLSNSVTGGASGASSAVWALLIQPDGKVIIGGDFTSVNGQPRTRVARLNVNGSLDGTFTPSNGPNITVNSLAIQSDGKILIGGLFTTVGGTNRNYVARLNVDGSLDSTFNPSTGVNGLVNSVAVQADGKVLIGGNFTTVFGLPRNRIARLQTDGSIDQDFLSGLSGASGPVRSVLVQSDGKILIGGDFFAVNNISRQRIARLLSSGALDTGFNSNLRSGINGSVYAMAVQSDGNVVAVGDFTNVETFSRSRIVRTYSDGSVDSSFLNESTGANLLVRCVALQSDGKPLVGGEFSTVNLSNRTRIARLYGDVYPPELVSHPTSRATNVGATVTFSVNVSNPTPVNYQWRKDGTNIPGATLNGYSLFNVQTGDSGNYSVFLSNGAGGTTSSNAVLNVGIAPVITSHPVSLTVTQGQSAAFNVSATGTPLNYIWRKNGAIINGATNAIFDIPSVVGSNAAIYSVIVSNFLGSVTSTGAVLTVFFPPTITAQPIGRTVGVNSNFTLNVTASGNPAIAYQWRKNESPIDGATASSYTVTTAQTNDSGDYDIIITNTFGSVTSSVALVDVIYYSPTITLQPAGGNKMADSDFTLTAAATGTAPLFWQWMKDGAPLANATASSYSVTGAQTNDSGAYTVVVTNIAGGATSIVANVNVGYPPVIVQQPQSVTNAIGGTAVFSCTVTGTAPIDLQWLFNGNLLAGETNAALTLTNLQVGNIGFYALAATNGFGGTVSSNAALNLDGYPFGFWDGLVAYYPFNGNANDESGNELHCTVKDVVATFDRFGMPNSAFEFNGLSSGIIQTQQALNIGQPEYTISIWFQSYDVANQSQGIFNTVPHNGFYLVLNHPQAPNVMSDRIGNGTSWISPHNPGIKTDYISNRWYHLVYVKSGTNFSSFIDGILDKSSDLSGALSFDSASGYRFGSIGDTLASSSEFFDGRLDDIRIYNRALSTNEIAQLFAIEMPLPVISQPQINSGMFGFKLGGLGEVVIEASDELKTWSPIATNISNGNPTFFTDPQTNLPARFYRVRQ